MAIRSQHPPAPTASLVRFTSAVEVDVTGTLKWSTFRRYDGGGRLIVVAQP
jgi:hypothetical protein